MSTFHLVISTPEKEIYNGEASHLSLSSEVGKTHFLAKHADFLGSVKYTRIVVALDTTTAEYIGKRGLVSFDNAENKAKVLLLDCQATEEISKPSVEAYLAYIEDVLRKGGDLSQSQLKFMEEEKIMLVKQIKDLEE